MARVRFSSLIEEGTGVYGDSAVARGRSGYVAKRRPQPKFRPTSGQAASMARMARASEAWNDLSRREAKAWNGFAKGISKPGYNPGTRYSPTGHNVFSALGAKLLQLDPEAELPRLPPARRFDADGVRIRATTGGGVPAEFVRLTADRPISEGEVVELLGFRMRNERSSARGRQVTQAFVAFEGPELWVDVPMEAGWWALGAREVCVATGEQTTTFPLGVVEIAGA